MLADAAKIKDDPAKEDDGSGDITREIKTGEELQEYINSLM